MEYPPMIYYFGYFNRCFRMVKSYHFCRTYSWREMISGAQLGLKKLGEW